MMIRRPERAVTAYTQAGDHLILLDSSWHADFPLAREIGKVKVWDSVVIYDF